MKNEVYTTYNAIVLSISSLFVLVFWYVLGVITFPKDWETHKGLLLIGKIVVEYLTSYGFYKLNDKTSKDCRTNRTVRK